MELTRDLMGGTEAMARAAERYIPKSRRFETAEEYESRLKRTVLLNAYKRAVRFLRLPAALTSELDGYRILGRAECGPGVEAYLYDRGDGQKTLAFWGKGGCGVSVACEGPARLVDWCGTPTDVKSQGGRVTVTAGRHVAYLSGRLDLKVKAPAVPSMSPT